MIVVCAIGIRNDTCFLISYLIPPTLAIPLAAWNHHDHCPNFSCKMEWGFSCKMDWALHPQSSFWGCSSISSTYGSILSMLANMLELTLFRAPWKRIIGWNMIFDERYQVCWCWSAMSWTSNYSLQVVCTPLENLTSGAWRWQWLSSQAFLVHL